MKTTIGFLGFALVAISLVSVTLAQQQPPQGGQCMQSFDQQLSPRCFDPRGLDFQGVLFLITQNVSGSLPPGETVPSYRQKVCRPAELDFIIPCVLQLKAQFTNATCTADEVTMIDTSGRSLLMILEQLCMEPCERNAMQSLSQCFVSAQINPDRSLNTSMTGDKFSFIGNTSADTERFCNVREQLFTCLRQVGQSCPTTLPRLYEMGIDIVAMQRTADLLCRERETYLGAFQCFFTRNQGIATCAQQTFTQLREVVIGRMETGSVTPSQFVVRLCGVRLNQVNCELQAFRGTCDASQTHLRHQAECTILPQPCLQEPSFQAGLRQMCQAATTPPTMQTTPRPAVTTPEKPHIVTKETQGVSSVKGGSAAITVSGILVSAAMLFSASLFR
ncbi:uncharacterized protein [Haliotis cracherodii]|uniref:uncharacterized protein n=1 Tax=Haliotis cracherodii TaxID=6455 RepID=UPI0039E933EA